MFIASQGRFSLSLPLLPVTGVLCLLGFTASAARAEILFNDANFTPNLSPPYASLEIEANAANGTVVFTLTPTRNDPGNSEQDLFQAFGFNSAVDTSLFSIVGPSGWSTSFDSNMDGFGVFDVELKGNGSNRVAPVVVNLQFLNASDYSLAVESNFVVNNTNGRQFAAHMIPFDRPAEDGTGFITGTGGSQPSTVPEPSSAALLAFGLLGAIGCRRRRESHTA